MTDPPACRDELFAFVLTGHTVFGEPARVVGAVPAPSFAEADRAVRLAHADALLEPVEPGRYPEMDVRTTVFRLPVAAMAGVLAGQGWRVAGPPA